MNSIFGISIDAILNILVVMLSVAVLWLVWLVLRRPVIFKMGIRNLPRRPAQTILIIVGLMLSTLIISAALSVGDTLNRSISSEVYDLVGHVDEVVVYSQTTEGQIATVLSTNIDAEALTVVEYALRDDPNVDGIMPGLLELVPVYHPATGLAEPELGLIGWDPARIGQFGDLKDVEGNVVDLAALPPGAVVLNESGADNLSATIGDTLVVFFNNQPYEVTVAALAPDSALSGSVNPGMPGISMALDQLQALTNQPDVLSMIVVSNIGGVREGLAVTDAVVANLEPALAGHGLGIQALKQDLATQSEENAELFSSLFLVMGLFSISAGILLIVLIFTMLAAERRSEMGIARAVGAHRLQLVHQFVAEGSAYAVFAGFVGAALGVLASLGIAKGLNLIFGELFTIEAYIRPRSLIVAYLLGLVITFAAVALSSWKISRLNIVAAVRDIPEIPPAKRRRSFILWGVLLAVLGALMTVSGQTGDQGAAFAIGMSVLPFGIALVLRYLAVSARWVFTAVGVWLLVFWLLPEEPSRRLFGEYDTGIEMFFISGIFLVLGATMIIVQNTDVLLRLISSVGGRLFPSQLPAVRTAIAYPGAARGRTGMTIAMFSLIIFSLIMMGTITRNFTELFLGDDANAGWDVQAVALTTNPISDFTGTLEANGIDTGAFTAVASVTTPHLSSQVRLPGEEWKYSPVQGMDESFITRSELAFQQRAAGYDSDEAVINALLTEPNVAVVDASAVASGAGFGQSAELFNIGIKGSDDSFTPIIVEVAVPDRPTPARVTVIAVIDSKIGSLFGIFANRSTVDTIYSDTQLVSYYVALADPEQSDETAKAIEAAMLQYGVQGYSIRDELKEAQSQTTAFFYIFEGFMGLGLIVGIAAIGVIAFRSVVERRQQIGVLRALGFQKALVARSFLIETGFIVGMGVLSGTALGLMLSRNLFDSEDFASASAGFTIPWGMVLLIAVLTMLAALLMTWIPARRAAGIAPAEALRYE